MKKTQLEINILAQNMLNIHSSRIIKEEQKYFAPLMGIDVFKIDYSLKKKYHKECPSLNETLPDGTHLSVTYRYKASKYGLDIQVKVCINGGSYEDHTSFTQYLEQSFEIALIEEGTNHLKPSTIDRSAPPKIYDIEEVKAAAAKVHELEKVYEYAYDNVPYMFRNALNVRRLN